MTEFRIGKLLSKDSFLKSLTDIPTVVKKNIEYMNVACAFDIEVSSFVVARQKMSCMYMWQFGINGNVVVGRTWEEFLRLMIDIKFILRLSSTRVLPIYIQNLSYEFQFIKHMFSWGDIFAREEREPMKATTKDGLEFRCSYMLSGCSLEQMGKELNKYKVNKLVGNLDYNLLRFPVTPLKKKEIDYGVNDVMIVMAYVQEEIETYGDITKIPMTKTGKVRMYCREKCLNSKNGRAYRNIMRSLTLDGASEYNMLKEAFQSGYVHANWQNSGDVFENVGSKDFISSYPGAMLEKMPMSKGEWIRVNNMSQIESMDKAGYYIVFNVEIHDIKEKEGIPDHYISLGKCHGVRNAKSDNGRLIEADRIQMTITSDDWQIIKRCYDINGDIIIGKAIRYQTAYLPKALIECVLDFYRDKTTLKGVEGFESEYSFKKGLLNAIFGCSVTDIVSKDVGYDDEWITNNPDVEEAIREYNTSYNRFLFYPWGVAICSKARKNLWTAILELGEDYIYSDTDSVKYINPEKHEAYFTSYNNYLRARLEKVCKIMKIDFSNVCPMTSEGEEKLIGAWGDDVKGDEKTYRRFKALGAKRYLVEYMEDGELHIQATISGVNKEKVSEYISQQDNPFEFFNDKMNVDSEHSGRVSYTYLDTCFSFSLQDYLGNDYSGCEMSGVHMCNTEYNLKLSPIYAALLGLKEVRYH